MHDLAADHGEQRLDAADLIHRNGHVVVREHGKIGELSRNFGLTVLMAEQNFNQAIRIADRGYIIVHGEIVVGAGVEELKGNDIVKRLYLGGAA